MVEVWNEALGIVYEFFIQRLYTEDYIFSLSISV